MERQRRDPRRGLAFAAGGAVCRDGQGSGVPVHPGSITTVGPLPPGAVGPSGGVAPTTGVQPARGASGGAGALRAASDRAAAVRGCAAPPTEVAPLLNHLAQVTDRNWVCSRLGDMGAAALPQLRAAAQADMQQKL
ncbi:MAG TPA: hypothetical protein PKH77_28160 [Anaerolineae bacterium]|nr:hypothetical protein [Anaerolineae bacterium]